MTNTSRIEQALEALVSGAGRPGCPPELAKALRYAVFPGGARVRPRLTLAVAAACGDDRPAMTDAAAAAVELLHCASLVHDDLPCFDNANLRRAKPTVHVAFGEPIALLAGDGMIVMAFEALARAAVVSGAVERLPRVLKIIARGVGAPGGLVAGQAWESEATIDLDRYHDAKTGALFVAATMAGAAAAGADPTPWRALGANLGAAYQTADDLLDAVSSGDEAQKPTGQDRAHGRPSAVAEFGVQGALARLQAQVQAAVNAVPDCPGAQDLRDLVRMQASRLTPKSLARSAA
ncbi:MAG: polyprenyl synthetase family protein [Alphaproteobacteria bacterium]|nr:polyprenyl synthetase family protein [Alphaproteobacteria bacterium]